MEDSVLYNQLKEYFQNTPNEQLDKEWEENKDLNKIGTDVIKYLKSIKK